MLLIFEVAIGVLIGLLVYRGLVSLSETYEQSILAILGFYFVRLVYILGLVGTLSFVGWCGYLLLTNPSYLKQNRSTIGWMATIIAIFSVACSIYSDMKDARIKRELNRMKGPNHANR